jgi:hypothetical protein
VSPATPDLADGDGAGAATAAEDATTLTLGASAPDPVIDVVLERVLQTGVGDGALGTDLLRYEHSHAVTREEKVRRNFLAFPPGHPFGIHVVTPFHAPS